MEATRKSVIGSGFVSSHGSNDAEFQLLINKRFYYWSRAITAYNLHAEALKIGDDRLSELWHNTAVKAERIYDELTLKIKYYNR